MIRRDFLKGMSFIPFAGFFGYKAVESITKPDLPVIEFAKKVMIPWKSKGIVVPFPVDTFHEKIAQSYEENIVCLVLKHRQGGFSTFNLIQGFYDAIHKPDHKSVYFSDTLSMSDGMSNLAYNIAVNNLELIWNHIKSISDWGIKFKNGSDILFASHSGLPRCYVDRVYFDDIIYKACAHISWSKVFESHPYEHTEASNQLELARMLPALYTLNKKFDSLNSEVEAYAVYKADEVVEIRSGYALFRTEETANMLAKAYNEHEDIKDTSQKCIVKKVKVSLKNGIQLAPVIDEEKERQICEMIEKVLGHDAPQNDIDPKTGFSATHDR